jgi:phosphatidylinositol alpha-1,6-mannosyltransferase
MKLAIVASEFPPAPGGMQQHALGVAQSLSRFYDVIVFTASQHRDHHYEVNFEVRPILQKKRRPDFKEIADANVDAILALNAGYAPLANYTSKPVFCYCHGNDFLNPWIDSVPEPLTHIVDNLRKKLRKIPYLRHYRHNFRPIMLKININIGLKRVKSIFVNSIYTKEKLISSFKNCKTPIYIAHPCVADYIFDFNGGYRPHAPQNGPIRLITIARLARNARKKNVDNILRALSDIKNDISFEYKIIGDGDMRSELESRARELGISAQVHFLGMRPNQEIPAFLDDSDLFVLPSKASERDVESFGIVYVEAAARGVPSLASRAGGAVDAVADGISGIILEASEPDDIAGGIRKFVAEREKFHAPKIIEFANNFRWERVAKFMHETIEEHIDI